MSQWVKQLEDLPEFGPSEPGLTTRVAAASVALAHAMAGAGRSPDSHRPDSPPYAAKERQGPTPKAFSNLHRGSVAHVHSHTCTHIHVCSDTHKREVLKDVQQVKAFATKLTTQVSSPVPIQ